jgi:hypothetical protein
VLPIAPPPSSFYLCDLPLFDRFVQLWLVNYIVALENVRRRVTADLHRHCLLHTSLHHISDGGSAQVVEEKSLGHDIFSRLGSSPGLPANLAGHS